MSVAAESHGLWVKYHDAQLAAGWVTRRNLALGLLGIEIYQG